MLPRFKSLIERWADTLQLRIALCLLSAVVVISLTSGCGMMTSARTRGYAHGDPQRGLTLVQEYGCHSCHAIPGVRGPKTWVGPPLQAWAKRHYIIGTLSNTPENLQLWLRHPQDVAPGTAMPDLGVTEQDAKDISAYLYTLRNE